jgi:hypothetical protein
MNYAEDLVQLNLFQKGINAFGQSPVEFGGAGINQKAQSYYDAGVPSNFIQDGDIITRLNVVDGYLQSNNFVTGVSGWQIKSDGSVEFDSGYFRGDITGASGIFSGALAVGTNAFHVDVNGNMWWGEFATYAAATYKISAAGVANLSGIVAASVAAENITGTTISAKTLYGCSIRTSVVEGRIDMSGQTINIYSEDFADNEYLSGQIYVTGNLSSLYINAPVQLYMSSGTGYAILEDTGLDCNSYSCGGNGGEGLASKGFVTQVAQSKTDEVVDNVQVKKIDLTMSGGIVVAISSESNWEDAE